LNFSADPRVLAQLQAKKFKRYTQLLKEGQSEAGRFWDVVVLTASDADQAIAYEEQLRWREAAGVIPRSTAPHNTRYHVVPDPPGAETARIGNGGATFVVLDMLDKTYGSELDSLKVLVLHAGGFSQRTPNHSVCGKIFAPVPVGPVATSSMLEHCFAMLCDIPSKACPCVFIKCADDIIIFDSDICDFSQRGFTALAHRSPVEIAYTHGVFALVPGSANCRRFLHKPSLDTMRTHGALLDGKEDEAYTDSAFAFDMTAARLLLAFFRGTCGGSLDCEIDAYGDFLQALGPEATDAYCENTGNTVSASSSLVARRRELFQILRGQSLSVAKVEMSRFWHIGTLAEMLEHFTGTDSFLFEASGGATGPAADGCAACSSLVAASVASGAAVAAGAVMEFCDIPAGCDIGSQSIISNVSLPANTKLPASTFIQTWAQTQGFVTHVLGSLDEVKKAKTLLGVPFPAALERLGLSDGDVWEDGKTRSIWTARLYPVMPTAAESVAMALRLLQDVTSPSPSGPSEWRSLPRASMASSVKARDIRVQLAMRRTAETAAVTESLFALFEQQVDVSRWEDAAPSAAGLLRGAAALDPKELATTVSLWLSRGDGDRSQGWPAALAAFLRVVASGLPQDASASREELEKAALSL